MRVNEVLDFLYDLGCSHDISDEKMKTLCTLLGVNFKDLQDWVIQPPVKC